MKKTLIALAVLAVSGTAFAQSAVTISGIVDINYGTVNAPGNVLGNQTGDISRVAHNGTATTNITISGTEDLGGGMSAMFRYEMNPDFVGGSGLTGGAGTTGYSAGSSSTSLGSGANGYSFVGVSTKDMGAVRLGRLNTGTLSAWGTGSVFGTALGSGFGSNGNVFTSYSSSAGNFNNSAPVRFNNAVEWTSPKLNDFTARVLYVPQVNKPGIGGESACNDSTNCTTAGTLAAGVNRAGATDFSLAYNKGPLNAIIAQQTIKVGSNDVSALVSPNLLSTASQTSKLTTLAANYAIGATTVYGAYWTEKQGTAVDAQAYMLGAKYTVGALSYMASMGNRNDKTSANVDKKVLGIGADYALSKRSALYARYETRDANKNSSADTAAAGVTKTMAVGVRHSF